MYFKKTILFFLCITAFYSKSIAQTKKITFFLQTDLDQLYLNDSVKISKCTIYLSNFKFYNQAQLVFLDTIKAHLVDLLDPNQIQFNIPANLLFNRVVFNIGVDSNTNVAGILTGDLDPRKGMYWAWQSGYINFKLEGILNTQLQQPFQYHVGGYAGKLNVIQSNSFEVYPNNKYTLSFNFLPMLQYCLAQKQYEIMSPQLKAVQLAKLLSENTTCTKVQNLTNE
jgi:hypothetical protein